MKDKRKTKSTICKLDSTPVRVVYRRDEISYGITHTIKI